MITLKEFNQVEMHVGTIIDVKPNKKSSAQITELYQPADLLNRQVICCTNLTPLHVGSVKSEVRVLGTDSPKGVVLLKMSQPVQNGERIY